MTKIAIRVMIWLINRLCAQHVMRPQLWHATPSADTSRMQAFLEIVDNRTEIPYGRVYLHPDRMREFFEFGIAGMDEYVAKCQALREERRDEDLPGDVQADAS